MKIAIVSQGWGVNGGVATVGSWLARGLIDRDHQVAIVDIARSAQDISSRRFRAPAGWLRTPRVRSEPDSPGVHFWGVNGVEIELLRYFPQRRLTRFLDSFDVIQIVAGTPAIANVVCRARPGKYLQVATTVGLERVERLREMDRSHRIVNGLQLPWLLRMEDRAMACVDGILVENDWMLKWVSSRVEVPVEIAPPGIDTRRFQPQGSWNKEGPIVGFGRLAEERKDWPTAVRAFEEFARLGHPQDLVIAGAGPIPPALAEAARTSPFASRIRIVPDVSAEQLPTLLAGGSVFLQSSREEGLGLAGIEAMACGLPVVAVANNGSRQYVRNGVNGWLVSPGHEAAKGLARRLQDILSSSRGVYSHEARQTALAHYSSEACLDRFERQYTQVTA